MKKNLKTIFIVLSLLILVSVIVVVINQTSQLVASAANVTPLFGRILGWVLITLYVVLALVPVILYLRLPRALRPPEDQGSPEYQQYLHKLSKRLKKNKHLTGLDLSDQAELEKGLKILNDQADELIKKNAATIFITTAISQSGRLDTITVLATQVRMVWQIARLYYQRPTLREMLQLYANVAGTAFVAGELNDIDIANQVEPIITSVLGASLTGSIPGITNVAIIVTNSLLTGSANAFLTLRVGVITKLYCGCLLKQEKSVLRRSASLEGAKMLSVIVMNSAGSITKSIMNAAIKAPGRISKGVIRSTVGKFTGKGKAGSDEPA